MVAGGRRDNRIVPGVLLRGCRRLPGSGFIYFVGGVFGDEVGYNLSQIGFLKVDLNFVGGSFWDEVSCISLSIHWEKNMLKERCV